MDFHRTFVVLFLSFVALRLWFHAQARVWRRYDHRPEGPAIVLLRVFGAIPMIALTFVYLFRPTVLDWASFQLNDAWRWLGAALAATSLPLLLWVHLTLGRNFSGELRLRPDHTLVTTGPYRWVRHPMYTVFGLLMSGFLLLTANWLIGGLGLAILALVLLVRTPREEAMMLDAFGDRYGEYMRRTGRYLPRRIMPPAPSSAPPAEYRAAGRDPSRRRRRPPPGSGR